VAERYSYLACAPFALLAAAGFAKLWLRWPAPALVAFALVVAVLFVKTREQSGIWHDSERLWNHTLAIDPANGVALGNLAVLELEQGQATADPRRALELLQRSSEHGQRAVAVRAAPRWLFNLAAARFRLAQHEPAKRAEHIAVAVDAAHAGRASAQALARPVEARWAVIHALVLYEADRFADALPIAEEARAGSPGDVEVARLVANLRMETGRHAEAVKLFEELLRGAPDNSLLWYDLSRTFERAGDAARARDAARSGKQAADRSLGARASQLPWYAELVRRSAP
jgi:tetratricopeptide (TPR) repeat protein